MRLTEHVEYQPVYLPNASRAAQCRTAIDAWCSHNAEISVDAFGLRWTPASALAFVQELSQLFQAYNRVLWQHFSYCASCGGQCCVVDASDVRPFDLLAVALLEERAPELGERIDTTEHGCIYLRGHHCTWPDAWRGIKCWSFYCLGSGPWPADASLHELYSEVTATLRSLVDEQLPAPLRRYEEAAQISLIATLDDPVAFAHALHLALDAIFVSPLHERYPLFDRARQAQIPPAARQATITLEESARPEEAAARDMLPLFVAEMMEAAFDNPPPPPLSVDSSPDQLLADLETLAWIAEGAPANAESLLAEMAARYRGAMDAHGTLWQRMAQQIFSLL